MFEATSNLVEMKDVNSGVVVVDFKWSQFDLLFERKKWTIFPIFLLIWDSL